MELSAINPEIKSLLLQGTVIPAHPLALHESRKMDERRQRILTRYYIACGCGGVAAGVHTTQFEIRDPAIALLEPVLKIITEEIEQAALTRPFIRVAGICGTTEAALKDAELAVKYRYDLGLVSFGGLQAYSEKQLIRHIEAISSVIPVFGFYLQPAVGGRIVSYDFWKDFADIPNVHAIKVAAFNRYQTLDVVRAVCNSARRDEIALYTGNDDNIVADLLTPYRFVINGTCVEKKFVGGLLGHWAVWTKRATALFYEIKQSIAGDNKGIVELLSKGIEITDMNAALFDAKNFFRGSIAGIHEVLRRQGLMEGTWCLSSRERLSDGQIEEIDRICGQYPQYTDDEFVTRFLHTQKDKQI